MEWEIKDEPSSEESDEASDSDSSGSSQDSSGGNPNIQSYVVMEKQMGEDNESHFKDRTKDKAPVLRKFLKKVCILIT